MGKELVVRSQSCPHPKGSGSQYSSVLGVLFYLCVQFCCGTPRFDAVTHMGKGLVLGINHAHFPTGRWPSAQQLSLFLWKCLKVL